MITPELGIALGSGFPGGFFNETALTAVTEVFAAQVLPTVVAADADPLNARTAANTDITATAMPPLRIVSPV